MPLNKASNIDFEGEGAFKAPPRGRHGIWTPWLVGLNRIETVMEGNKQEGGGVAAMALLD